jgi:phenylalanyl-tRNA synthetase alpha chain
MSSDDITGRLRTAAEAGAAALRAARSLDELDAVKSEHLGKRSSLSQVQRGLGGMDPDARRAVGAAVNATRETLLAAEAERRAVLTEERDQVVLAAEAVDVTLPPRTPRRGSLHPVHETLEAMVDLFVGLGYRAVTGPEVESEWFNFEALNIPADHPARSLMDTIYVRGLGAEPDAQGLTGLLLRTHTSPMQARVMLEQDAPVYVVIPGRVYRSDVSDATHLPAFHQIEGLAIDSDLSFADLRGTLAELARALLGPQTRIRMRPHHFRFTEPSCEVDAFHNGQWMELLGGGMVHPNVLRAVGYDPEEVQGFAFGIGVERIAMLRHGVTDIRLFVENDLRFLSAFSA